MLSLHLGEERSDGLGANNSTDPFRGRRPLREARSIIGPVFCAACRRNPYSVDGTSAAPGFAGTSSIFP